MKILWACGNEIFNKEQSELVELITQNGHDVEITEKFQKRHVIKELNTTKDYDVLIINEHLENQPFEVELIENIIDSYSNDLKIVFIVSDEHVADDYANNLIAIGVSNVLYMKHVTAANLHDLIQKKRERPEAKVYLGISNNVTGIIKETINVSGDQIQNILLHIQNEQSADGKYQVYDRVEKDFNQSENLYILSYFPEELIEELHNHPTVALFIEKGYQAGPEEVEVSTPTTGKSPRLGKGKPEVKIVEKTVVKTEEVIVERIVNKSFKKLILTVWDNAEFGCELAYIAAKMTGLKVLVIDADLLAPKADVILNVERTPKSIASEGLFTGTGLNIVLDSINQHTYRTEILFAACVGKNEVKNLHVMTGNYEINNYEYYTKDSYNELLEKAYQNFDLTVVLVNKSMYDLFTALSLLKSDYNIIPIEANLMNIREYNGYIEFLEKTQKLQLEKNKYVAFEYRSGVNLDKHVINSLIGNNFLGYVSYDTKRIHYRNLKPAYAKRMPENIINEYLDMLSTFNIAKKRTFNDKMKSYFAKYKLFGRSIKKRTGKMFTKKKGRE